MVNAESGTDPLTAPLTYPGLPPRRAAVLVTGTAVLDVLPLRAVPPGEWPVRRAGRTRRAELAGPDIPLDRFLRDAGAPPLSQRTPVLSVGSNASPAQVRRKMSNAGLPTVLPMAAVQVHGLAVGVSAHVSRAGYVPATPVADPAAVSQLWVVWLGPEALIAMDATEPNYRRVRLPSRYPVCLTSGAIVPDCSVYLSRHGHLINSEGEPRRLTDQATLISGLLAEVPGLMTRVGATPREWLRRVQDEQVREDIRGLFRAAGIVRTAVLPAGHEPAGHENDPERVPD
jgi:hypothetical protein